MKTSIKTLIAALLTIVTLGAATPAVKAENNTTITVLNNVKNISKIVVTGNVELILVQDSKESVSVYDSYYAKNALVQQEGNVLRVSSFTKDRLTIVAHVKNITSVEASNNAVVLTKGTLNLIGLDMILKDNAKADISVNAINIYTSVSDKAELKLAGKSVEYAGVMGVTARISMDKFTAESSNIRSVSPVYSAKIALTKESAEEFQIEF